METSLEMPGCSILTPYKTSHASIVWIEDDSQVQLACSRNACAHFQRSAQDALRGTEMWREIVHLAGPVSCMRSW